MRHAVFTIVQDEPFFYSIWYKHYRQHFDYQNIYTLYHSLPGEDGDTEPWWLRVPAQAGVNLVHIFREKSFDHTWLREQVERFAGFLLGSYDTVTFAEVDEIITVDPDKSKDLRLADWFDNWCGRGGYPAVRCNGYEVVHRFDDEPGLDPMVILDYGGSRVLKDRNWWYSSVLYSKTLTWRVQPRWDNGFHSCYIDMGGGQYEPLRIPREPSLLLVHLHKVDYQIAAKRWRRTSSRVWNEADKQGWSGLQNRFRDESQLRDWWYRSVDNAGRAANLVQIPATIRSII